MQIVDKENGYPGERWIYDTIDSLDYMLNDKSKKQIDEDYDPNNYKPKWKREDRGKH